MTLHSLPLVHDRRLDRSTPVAAVELTEADLRLVAVALAHSAQDVPVGWHSCERDFENLGRRFKRIAGALRSLETNGAATARTAPRHDSQEVTL